MSLKFIVGQGWEFEPSGTCSVSGGTQSSNSSGSGQGTSQSQSTSTPENLQNPSFIGLSPQTAGTLSTIGLGGGTGTAGGLQNFSPFQAGGVATNSSSNPLVAPVTGAQSSTLGQIGGFLGQLPQNLSSAFGQLQNEMTPGFASGLATSPQTLAAEQSAIAPIRNQFTSQTVPGLQGSFTQAGQRIGGQGGQGSSAFDNAFSNAQGNELATEAATTGQIANNAYQTGLNIQANAPGQMASIQGSELNNLVSGLNAQALPQLTQQYGISAGTQLYNQQMATILQALGVATQGEQPAIGYQGQSTSSGQESSQNQSSSGGFNFGFGGFGNSAAKS